MRKPSSLERPWVSQWVFTEQKLEPQEAFAFAASKATATNDRQGSALARRGVPDGDGETKDMRIS
jgi:hypothetical protein